MAKKKSTMKAKAKSKKAAAKPKRAAMKRKPSRVQAKAARKPSAAARKKTVRRKAAPTRRSSRPAVATAPQRPSPPGLAPGYGWVTPHLVVRDMNAAIGFYTQALGFIVRSTMPGPGGQLMHAELLLNDATVMLGPESPERGSLAPRGPSPVTLFIYTANVDEVAARAAGLGGTLMQPPIDMFWGDRCAVIVDPQGHSWMIGTHIKDLTPEEMMAAAEQFMSAPPSNG